MVLKVLYQFVWRVGKERLLAHAELVGITLANVLNEVAHIKSILLAFLAQIERCKVFYETLLTSLFGKPR